MRVDEGSDTRHRWMLVGLLLFAAASGGVKIARTDTLTEDGVGFIRYARQLGGDTSEATPNRLPLPDYLKPLSDKYPALEIIAGNDQHPGYPLLILGTHRLLAPYMQCPEEQRWMVCGQLVGLIAGLILIVVSRQLAKELHGDAAGTASAAIMTLSPQLLEQRSDALSDMPALACLALSAWFAVRLLRHDKLRDGILCFLAGGFGYLIRPESLQIALVAGGIFLVRRILAGNWKRNVAVGTALALAGGTFTAPYVAVRGTVRTKSLREEDPVIADQSHIWKRPQGTSNTLLASMDDSSAGKYGHGVWEFLRGWGKNVGLPFIPVLITGFFAVRKQWKDPGQRLVLLMVLANALLLPLILYVRKGYLDLRHTMPATLMTAGYCGPGLTWIHDTVNRWRGKKNGSVIKWVAAGFVLTGLAQCGPTMAKPMHGERCGQRRAGAWLKQNAPADATILDPAGVACFHAERGKDNHWEPCPQCLFGERLQTAVKTSKGPVFLVLNDREITPQVVQEQAGKVAGCSAEDVQSFPCSRDKDCKYRVHIYRLSRGAGAKLPLLPRPPGGSPS